MLSNIHSDVHVVKVMQANSRKSSVTIQSRTGVTSLIYTVFSRRPY